MPPPTHPPRGIAPRPVVDAASYSGSPQARHAAQRPDGPIAEVVCRDIDALGCVHDIDSIEVVVADIHSTDREIPIAFWMHDFKGDVGEADLDPEPEAAAQPPVLELAWHLLPEMPASPSGRSRKKSVTVQDDFSSRSPTSVSPLNLRVLSPVRR